MTTLSCIIDRILLVVSDVVYCKCIFPVTLLDLNGCAVYIVSFSSGYYTPSVVATAPCHRHRLIKICGRRVLFSDSL